MKCGILFFLQSGVGGAERVTITIAKYLDKNKYDVSFCIIGDQFVKSPILHFIPDGYNIEYIKRSNFLSLFYNFVILLKKYKPSVVFSSMMYINTKLLVTSLFFPNTRFIVRNNNYLYTLSKFQRTILRLTYRLADYIIAQTDEMRYELIEQIGLPSTRVLTIQNPLDIDAIEIKRKEDIPFSRTNKVVYVASGRFNHVKGFDILIMAFKNVHDSQRNSELYIIGKNDENCAEYYNQVNQLIKSNNLCNCVHCEGFQSNPYKYVANADCFVLSSRNEGLPNVLIESLYLGTPVAATKCIPVIERIVDDGKNGYLAETENSDSLANAMISASKLGRVESYYNSTSKDDFEKLFS